MARNCFENNVYRTDLVANKSSIIKVWCACFADNTTECAYPKEEVSQTTLLIAMYIMLAVIVLCAIPLVILFIQWQYHQHCRHKCLALQQTDQDNLLEANLNSGNTTIASTNSR